MRLEDAITLNDKYKQNNTSGILIKSFATRNYLIEKEPEKYDFSYAKSIDDAKIMREQLDREVYRRCRTLCEMNYFKKG